MVRMRLNLCRALLQSRLQDGLTLLCHPGNAKGVIRDLYNRQRLYGPG